MTDTEHSLEFLDGNEVAKLDEDDVLDRSDYWGDDE